MTARVGSQVTSDMGVYTMNKFTERVKELAAKSEAAKASVPTQTATQTQEPNTSNPKLCPYCQTELRKSAKGWLWCPKHDWNNPRRGCRYKGRWADEKGRPFIIKPLLTASEEQKALFAEGHDLTKSQVRGLLITALAGTGKTTALVQLTRIWDEQFLSVILLCFATRDRTAMESRIPSSCAVIKTSNGAGLSILSDYAKTQGLGRIDLNEEMASQILNQRLRDDGLIVTENGRDKCKLAATTIGAIYQAVDHVRTVKLFYAPQVPTDADFLNVLDRFGVEYEAKDEAVILHYALWLFQEMADLKYLGIYGVDFTGQTFLPVYHDLKPARKYQRVACDECQDQSPYNRALIFKFLEEDGVVVAVGDEHQAIYEWRGADSGAVGEMEKLMRARGTVKTMPLTLCRRCSKVVINKYAKRLVPAIQALPDAPDGLDRDLLSIDSLLPELSERKKGLVICRANAPLFSLCLKLLSRGVAAVMLRSNVMGQLLDLVDSLSGKNRQMTIPDLLVKAGVFLEGQLAKAAKRKDGESFARKVTDRHECLTALSQKDGVNTVGDLCYLITSLFPTKKDETPDPNNIVVLSTVHGAKGGEAKVVYIVSPPGKDGTSIYDQVWSSARDRDNTLYVAVTRCEFEIVFVGPKPTFERFSDGPIGDDEDASEDDLDDDWNTPDQSQDDCDNFEVPEQTWEPSPEVIDQLETQKLAVPAPAPTQPKPLPKGLTTKECEFIRTFKTALDRLRTIGIDRSAMGVLGSLVRKGYCGQDGKGSCYLTETGKQAYYSLS